MAIQIFPFTNELRINTKFHDDAAMLAMVQDYSLAHGLGSLEMNEHLDGDERVFRWDKPDLTECRCSGAKHLEV